MMHDALFMLWDCNVQTKKNHHKVSNEGDEEIFKWICSIAKHHHRIQNYIDDLGFYSRATHLETLCRSTGLYAQALSEGITEVLQSYKETLIDVERKVVENHSLTLSFIYSHVEKYRSLFHSITNIINTIKQRQLNGCQILCLVHQHILTGNEVVHENILKIFSNINKVFITQLCSWLLYGELKDVNNEFFIYKTQIKEGSSICDISSPSHADIADKTHMSSDLETELGHKINPNMIPHYMPLSLAQEILFIGKIVILFGFDPSKVKRKTQILNNKLTLDMKRHTNSRRFTIWEEKEAIFHEKLQKLNGTDFEICELRIVIREIKECVTKHLWFVVVEEANLLHEFRLMKDFYLVGRGELFLELLRRASHLLEGPITRTSTRDMNQAFQSAARAVFLSNSPDIGKFSFHLPYSKPNTHNLTSLNYTSGEDSSTVSEGWSGIVLRYARTWPLHAVFTSEVLERYNRMFRLLLRIKNTQHNLHALWNTYKHSTSFPAWQLHNKLMFLVDNLQHYLQADVLETNFCKLMDVAANTRDFEILKQAHLTFLDDVLSQSFLTVTETPENYHSTESMNIDNPVFNNITELLKLCHAFCEMSEDAADLEERQYYLTAYTERFNRLVKQLMQLLVSLREHPSGIFLARLLMRLDYNRWLSGEAQLTQSVTNMLR